MTERPTISRPERGRLLVVSHACVLPVNQHVYARLAGLGWDVTLVTPAHWRHEYEAGVFESRALPELVPRLVRLPVMLEGRPQRHVYRARLSTLLRRTAPHVAFLEEETFSLPALQWGFVAYRAGIPFGTQADENLDRSLPRVARAARAWTIRHAAFVAARSPAAGELARRWGALGSIPLVPHAVPDWTPIPRIKRRPFTVGFAGRLVPEKGVWDLVQAAGALEPPIRLLLVGDGPLRRELEHVGLPNGQIEVWPDRGHDGMPRAYAEMDVLALPSRTTERWAEQFGRVLAEALWCGVPVVGSDSGEIPWVISTTGGGLVFREGDIDALTSALARLEASPGERRKLAERGGKVVRNIFSVDAAASALDAALIAAVERSARAARRTAPSAGSSAVRKAVER